jgi:hypothetical protein
MVERCGVYGRGRHGLGRTASGKPCFFFLYFFVLFLTFLQESRKRNPIYFLNYLPARKKSRLSFKK